MNKKYITVGISIILIILMFMSFLFAPNDPQEADIMNRFQSSSNKYLLGTDHLGRCVLSRLLYGGKTTLGIILFGGLIIFIVGTLLGVILSKSIIGTYSIVDGAINAITSIPPIAYLIVFIGAWGNGIRTMILAMTVSYSLRYMKLVKTKTDLELKKAYVLCVRSSGASKFRILFVHILPNIFNDMIEFISLSSADMILTITGFSFIGLNLGDNVVDWGTMILESRNYGLVNPKLIIYPILAVIISSLTFNIMGSSIGGLNSND
ncbi:ABC transporter permease [Tissierella praeacuta]|uniref:ABC transporter permease n=1 Tax=Tissierella praeacuta TaxID=43131 RepID=UPI0033429826